MIAPGPLSDLAEQLERLFQVHRANSIKELKATVSPVSIDGRRLQFAGHFRLEADLCIVDPVLETISLAYALSGSPEELRAGVNKCLERGSYTRHLLLTEALRQGDVTGQKFRAYTVEIVLSVCGSGAREAVHSALLEISRESEILYSLGVNILHRASLAEEFSELDLRRAFCWLLRDTKSWFSLGEVSPSKERLHRMELTNYRLPGQRTLELIPETRLHLIHGYNGTGKSTFVEALELATTGRIDRFPGSAPPDSYFKTIANNREKPVEVQLELQGRSQKFAIRSDTVEHKPLLPSCYASSFRLDQALMDRLTLPQNRGIRGATILQAFFPEDASALAIYNEARRKAEGSREALPEAVRTRIATAENPPQETERLLGWIDHDAKRVPREVIDLALPAPLDDLEPLDRLSSELKSFLDAWRAPDLTVRDAKALLPKLDSAVLQVIEMERRVLSTAIAVLERLSNWYVEEDGDQARENFQVLLDQWLETRALRDLVEKEAQIVRILRFAEQNGWSRDSYFQRPGVDESSLLKYQDQLAARGSNLLRKLSAHESSTATGSDSDPRRPSISPQQLRLDEIAALDTAGGWLEISGFGDAVRTAVEERRPVAVGNLAIGRRGWTESLEKDLKALREHVLGLRSRGSTREANNGQERLALFQKALVDQRALVVAESLQEQTWLQKVFADRSLANALNELVALLTPARWAYEPIGLSQSVDAQGVQEVRYETETNQEIDLRFNSAELNVMVVALFFLCAPRRPNPLGTLILDDPLQNMDELTATTVARGLAKLSKLWPPELQTILLFHGEDQLERFRREVPAAVYRLPWLSPVELPSPDGKATIIRVEPTLSSHLSRAQDLLGLLEEFDS